MASATVFPDGRIEDKHLKNLCALFDVVHIGMPWVMEPTQSMKHALKLGIIEIHRPAESLKLETELKSLLRDYENLALWYKEGALSSYLKAAIMGAKEETRWEISQAVKTMGKKDPGATDVNGLYLQLLLHLYQQTEENKKDVEFDLESLEISGSPLADALGEEEHKEFDRPATPGAQDLTVPVDLPTLGEVIRGWTVLFPTVLPRVQAVVTINREVFDFLTGQFEEAANTDIKSARPLMVMDIRLISTSGIPWQDFVSRQISIVRQKVTDMLDLASGTLTNGNQDQLDHQATLINEYLRSSFALEGKETYQVSLCLLPALSPNSLGKYKISELFSGKLLINLTT